ncbi:hypothetical protein ACH42_07925 [Endozoicomonas sp. (ex Bugula neritina AB1)]|nr:hypothetical protein ACH42_07925 [Endozoicomonas sp. (ex Bugula neritina AB1)]
MADVIVKTHGRFSFIRLSPIWLLPCVAFLVVVWLIWKVMSEAGVHVEVQFETGRGIKQGSTEVRHNGIAVGKVKTITATDDLKAVNVKLEMDRRLSPYLTDRSRFWLVQPQVNMAGISGLETLVSGNYIAFQPSMEGARSDEFVALQAPPAHGGQEGGLSLTLRATELSSVQTGSPVYYRRFKIGEVSSYNLSANDQFVDVQVFISPKFTHLVKRNTRFWNAGGVDISGSLTSLKVRTQSIVSMIQGGISLYTPDWEESSPEAVEGDLFPLYRDYDEAEAGIAIDIHFPLGIAMGGEKTKILFHGKEVGLIKETEFKEDYSGIIAKAVVRPEAVNLMVDGARFWLVKPSVGLQGVSGLETLLGGRYVNMDVSQKAIRKAVSKRSFKGLPGQPPASLSAQGLHLKLHTDSLGGISYGSPVLYRKVPVGSVQRHEITNKGVLINILIKPRYQHLVNTSSRFWNVSGINVQGGLQGFNIEASTLNSLLVGGITFDTPKREAAQVKNNTDFILHDSAIKAHQTGKKIALRFENAEGLQVGAKVKYKGLVVGQVMALSLDSEDGLISANILLNEDKGWLAREGSRFWLIKPTFGLTNTSNLETLVTGQYIEVLPTLIKDARERLTFNAEVAPLDDNPLSTGLRLELVSDRLGSIRRGNPVYYREIPVGTVTGYRLADPASQVLVFINIEERYRQLVTEDSRFWNASGIDVKFGLFSGAEIRTESVEALLAGGIAFATPEVGEPVAAGSRFLMAKEVQPQWLQWAPAISLSLEADR